VIQGGDPLSKDDDPSNDGLGNSNQEIMPELGMKHIRGSVGAARLRDEQNPQRKSSGCQFYICLKDLPSLDHKYTVFGKVIAGIEVADSISMVQRDPISDNPVQKVIMKRVYLIRTPK